MKSFAKFLVFVVVTSALGAGVYSHYRKSTGDAPKIALQSATLAQGPRIDLKDVPLLDALNREYTNLIKNIVPSVVAINTSRRGYKAEKVDRFGRVLSARPVIEPNSLGSGVIVSKEGHIITNNHVIASGRPEAIEIEVQLSDGRTLPARVIDADPFTDIAILKVDGEDLQPLPFGNSEEVLVGERVFAVGNPFGLAESVTDGIISAKGRQSMDDTNISEFLQTNAAINPGNSGGPLINIRGEIIGINTMIASQSGGFQGIGMAVPSNTARRIFDDVIKQGRVIRGYLGISSLPWKQVAPQELGVDRPEGVIVNEVYQGSPADRANIQQFDIIVRFAGKAVNTFTELRREIDRCEINDVVDVEVIREGQKVVLKLRIEEPPMRVASAPASIPGTPGLRQTPSSPVLPPSAAEPSAAVIPTLGGIEVHDLTPKTREQLDLPNGTTGVVVRSIPRDSAAWDSLRVNDVIETVNKIQVSSMEDFVALAGNLNPAETNMLTVYRERTRTVVMIRPS